jgi:hypothetical protein
VIKKLVAALRKWITIAMVWVKVIIHLAAEIVWTMEPRAGCDENSTAKPLGSTVPIWGAVVRREVVVIIWAGGFWSDVDRDQSDRQSLKYSAKQRERAR